MLRAREQGVTGVDADLMTDADAHSIRFATPETEGEPGLEGMALGPIKLLAVSSVAKS